MHSHTDKLTHTHTHTSTHTHNHAHTQSHTHTHTNTHIHTLTHTQFYRDQQCSFAFDIWQAGCCVLAMCTGRRPWRHLFMDVFSDKQPERLNWAMKADQRRMVSILVSNLVSILHGRSKENGQYTSQ